MISSPVVDYLRPLSSRTLLNVGKRRLKPPYLPLPNWYRGDIDSYWAWISKIICGRKYTSARTFDKLYSSGTFSTNKPSLSIKALMPLVLSSLKPLPTAEIGIIAPLCLAPMRQLVKCVELLKLLPLLAPIRIRSSSNLDILLSRLLTKPRFNFFQWARDSFVQYLSLVPFIIKPSYFLSSTSEKNQKILGRSWGYLTSQYSTGLNMGIGGISFLRSRSGVCSKSTPFCYKTSKTQMRKSLVQSSFQRSSKSSSRTLRYFSSQEQGRGVRSALFKAMIQPSIFMLSICVFYNDSSTSLQIFLQTPSWNLPFRLIILTHFYFLSQEIKVLSPSYFTSNTKSHPFLEQNLSSATQLTSGPASICRKYFKLWF